MFPPLDRKREMEGRGKQWERKRGITPTLHRRKTTGSTEINRQVGWGKDRCIFIQKEKMADWKRKRRTSRSMLVWRLPYSCKVKRWFCIL